MSRYRIGDKLITNEECNFYTCSTGDLDFDTWNWCAPATFSQTKFIFEIKSIIREQGVFWYRAYCSELNITDFLLKSDLDQLDLLRPNYSKIWRNICSSQTIK